jgi:hypothetical protein
MGENKIENLPTLIYLLLAGDNIKMDVKEVKWINLAKDKDVLLDAVHLFTN